MIYDMVCELGGAEGPIASVVFVRAKILHTQGFDSIRDLALQW